MNNEAFNQRKISETYVRFSLPLILSMVVSLIYNLADTYFVAQTNNTNIVTGVSLGSPVFTLLMAFGNIFGQGGSSLIARYLGGNNFTRIRKVSSYCFYTAVGSGAAIGLVMLFFRSPMVWLLGADSESYSHAMAYYIWLALGAPFTILSFAYSNLLRAEGLSRESMIGTVFGALVNIVLDPIFISVLSLGAGGAAIATDIGYLCSDLFFTVIIIKKSRILSLNPKEYRIPGKDIGQIFQVGIPSAVANLMQSVSIILVNQFLLPYGNEKIAAMGIALKVSMIVLLLLTGFTFGGAPLFSYYYGAGNRKKLRELLSFVFRSVIILALAVSGLVFVLSPVLMRIFIDTPEIIADGAMMLRWQVVTMVFVGIVLLITIIFQSFGKGLGAFLLSISRQGIVFLIVLLTARVVAGYNGIIASQAIADIISAALSIVLFTTQLKKDFMEKPADRLAIG